MANFRPRPTPTLRQCPTICNTSPYLKDDTDTAIDQNGINNDAESSTCTLNSLIVNINEQLSKKLGYPVNIDIDQLIACNPKWQDGYRIADDGFPMYKWSPYPWNNPKARAQQIQNLKNKGFSINTIKLMIQILTFIQYMGRAPAQNGLPGLVVPLSCEPMGQIQVPTYSPGTAKCPDSNCSLRIDLREITTSADNNKRSFCTLLNILKTSGPIMVSFDLNQLPGYNANSNSNTPINGDVVYTYNGQATLGYGHAVSFIGYECKNGNVELIFRDSYAYGSNPPRPGTFRIAVPDSLMNNPLPIELGTSVSSTDRLIGYIVGKIYPDPADNLKAICCTPSPTPTVTPTITPSSSYDTFSPFKYLIP